MLTRRWWTLYLLVLLVTWSSGDPVLTNSESMLRLTNVSCCDKCRCINTDVLCDGVKLPSLPLDCSANTTRMSFVGCGLSNLDDGELGKHYQRLESLDISGNRINVLRSTTFAGLKDLHVLNIGNNIYSASQLDPLVFSLLPNIRYVEVYGRGDATEKGTERIVGKAWMNTVQGLENSTIETIIFKHISKNPVVVEKSYCKYLKNSPVKNIILTDMEIVDIDIDCLEYLPGLEVLDLSDNTLGMSFSHFKMMMYLYKLINLRQVIIKNNVLRYDSTVVEEAFTKEQAMESYQFPKSIQSIDLSGSVLARSSLAFSYGFRIRSDNQLSKVDLSGIKLCHSIGDKVIGFVKMRELHFQNNECELSAYALSCLRGAFESLEILDVSNNYINFPPEAEENTTKIFNNCTKLQYLDMSNGRIKYIPSTAFQDMSGLRTLSLSGNSLGNLNIRIRHLTLLEMLNISRNKLQTIPKYTRDDLDYLKQHRNVGVKLDLTDNPLLCGCHSTDFIEWMQAYSEDIHYWDMLECTFFNGSVIQMRSISVPVLRITCIKNLILASTIPSGILMIVMIVAIVVYMRRYKIQYIYLQLKAALRHHGKDNANFDFDGFISYSSLDKTWGQEILYANLVGKYHYKICIDDVNFRPGSPISAAITDAITKSNKVILILTQNFLRSKWCAFELNLANGELASRGRDCLVLILKEPVDTLPKELITDTLRSILDTRIYLEWSEDADRKEVFWRRLRDALGVPSPRNDQEQAQTGTQYIAPQSLEDETRVRDFLEQNQSMNDDERPLLSNH